MATASAETRFALLLEEDLDALLRNRQSKQTKNVIRGAVKVFEQYAIARNTSLVELESGDSAALADFLRKFYAEMRTVEVDRRTVRQKMKIFNC